MSNENKQEIKQEADEEIKEFLFDLFHFTDMMKAFKALSINSSQLSVEKNRKLIQISQAYKMSLRGNRSNLLVVRLLRCRLQ